MSQKEYAEDTVFWSLKHAEQFSARRRTLTLFVANSSASTGADSYTWIDNTKQVWADVVEVLESHKPSSIAVNIATDIAFSSGMHAGELVNVTFGVGLEWAQKFVSKPMLAVEFIATMPTRQLDWYKRLQETAWAMISEAFSESVIVPGETHTSVSSILRLSRLSFGTLLIAVSGC